MARYIKRFHTSMRTGVLKPENTYKCQIGMKTHLPFQHVKGRDQGSPQQVDQLDQPTLARFRFSWKTQPQWRRWEATEEDLQSQLRASNHQMHVHTCTQSSSHTNTPTYILTWIYISITYMWKKKAQLSNLHAEREVARHRNEMQRASW